MIALVGLVLLISVSFYVGIAWTGKQDELAAELASARTGGLQTVCSAFEDLPQSDHVQRDLRQLVATFDGNRHVRAAIFDRFGRLRFASSVDMLKDPAPPWFVASLSPDLVPSTIPVPDRSGDMLVLEPEPASDVAALWSASVQAAKLFMVAVGLGLGLVYAVIGRALAPLADLSRGLEAIGAGKYRERVAERGPPELLSLERGFNAMAERLSRIDARNRALESQLLTIQDEERAEIARDLHDEIGPYLFAVSLDAEMIGRGLSEGEAEAALDQVRSIQSAVSYMQRRVRELIARLRPTRAAELGLEAALGDLVAFWQMRQPEVEFATKLEDADAFVPEPLRDVIYRVAQESVANAIRHADTTCLRVALVLTGDEIALSIVNRGSARSKDRHDPGLGLASMRKRVHAAGGILKIDKGSQGWSVVARFAPLSREALAA